MVTGGFRSRAGINEAVSGGEIDLLGLGRPAVMNPSVAHDILSSEPFQAEDGGDAKLDAPSIPPSLTSKLTGIKILAVSPENVGFLIPTWQDKRYLLLILDTGLVCRPNTETGQPALEALSRREVQITCRLNSELDIKDVEIWCQSLESSIKGLRIVKYVDLSSGALPIT